MTMVRVSGWFLLHCSSLWRVPFWGKPPRFGASFHRVHVNETVCPDGSKYIGEVDEKGLKCGQGILANTDGSIKSGEWKNDRLHGKGIYVDSLGWSYVGEWKDGKVEGKGVATFPDGFRFSGEWKQGGFTGHGVINTSRGVKYEGDIEFKNGKFSKGGHGIFTLSDGTTFEKEWYESEFCLGELNLYKE